MKTEAQLMEQLEPLVDEHGLQMVIDTLASLCGEKADHIESNWQDRATANTWRLAGRQIAEFIYSKRASALKDVSP